MTRIDGGTTTANFQSLAQQNQTGMDEGALPGQTGSLRGESVQVKEVGDVLADAAEEISVHMSQKDEVKKHGERSIESDVSAQIMKLEEINAYLDMKGMFSDPKKLAELTKRMQSGDENPRELARQQSRDPALQYVLLQHALVEGKSSGISQSAQERLQDAIADLEMERGPEIRAGINTAGVAASTSSSPAERENFQDAYRDVVLGQSSMSQTLKTVFDRFTNEGQQQVVLQIGNLIKALGADLSAARPSQDSSRLQALVQDLYQLEVAVTVLDRCTDLAAMVASKFSQSKIEPLEMMKALVAVTGEKWVGATRFTAMEQQHQLKEVPAQIAFHSTARDVLRQIPPAIFADTDTRQSILNASQEALDMAIDKEDAL